MSQSARLSLPYLEGAQAQKHVTVNQTIRRLDALVQLAVESATLASQPVGPADGQVYILPPGKTGAAWGAMANGALAYWRDGAWEQITPREGWLAFVKDADRLLVFDGTAWVAAMEAADLGLGVTDTVQFGRLGVGGAPWGGAVFHGQAAGADAELRLQRTDGTGYFRVRCRTTLAELNHEANAGNALIDFNPAPLDGTSAAAFRFFRATSTTGAAQLEIFRGDGTSARAHVLQGKTFSILDQQGYKVKVGANATPVCALDVEGAVRVASYTVATVPSAAAGAGQIIFVSNESGGAVLAFSDGTAWRRVTDRAAIS